MSDVTPVTPNFDAGPADMSCADVTSTLPAAAAAPVSSSEIGTAVAPAPAAELAPDPDPPGTLSGPIKFVPGFIDGLRAFGWLTVPDPAFEDVVDATWSMLGAAVRSNIRAAPPAPPLAIEPTPAAAPPAPSLPRRPLQPASAPSEAEAKRRAEWAAKMAAMNALSDSPYRGAEPGA
jgi:hypothetical protein